MDFTIDVYVCNKIVCITYKQVWCTNVNIHSSDHDGLFFGKVTAGFFSARLPKLEYSTKGGGNERGTFNAARWGPCGSEADLSIESAGQHCFS